MPLSVQGAKVLRAMIKQYGKRKGTQVFYATAKKQGKRIWFISEVAKRKHG